MIATPKLPNKIALLFWEELPSKQAGDCIELIATDKKHAWVGGRESNYPLDEELSFSDNFHAPILSRLHFTIYYDLRNNEWILIDGGVFKGEQIPTRSKNGVWVRNEETGEVWEQIRGQIKIYPHTFIWLGPSYRIIVAEDCTQSTVGGYLWEQSQWDIHASPVTSIPLIDESIFRDLAKKNEPTMWSVVQDWSDWLQASPANHVDLINRICVVGCLLLVSTMAITYVHLKRGGNLPGVEVVDPE